MFRPVAPFVAALGLLGLASVAAPAAPLLPAPCSESIAADGTPLVVCGGISDDRLIDARDGLTLVVAPGGAIRRDAGRPVQLDGDAQRVVNFGEIRSGNDDAIRSDGTNLTVLNSGLIEGGDRGIRLRNGDGGFSLVNTASGEMHAVRQAVRLDNEALVPDGRIENWGLIESFEGRAVQSRGPGTVVLNYGTLLGGEEVVEGRQDFYLENHGTIAIRGLRWDGRNWFDDGAVPDEDGVQFSGGEVHNWGVILSTDDGIDIDEGTIRNYATGVIVSVAPDTIRDSGGIDVDELFQFSDPDLPERRPGLLTIVNEGYIEGPRAIVTDFDADSPLVIENSGTLVGRGGDELGRIAIDLAPNQGDTTIALFGGSVVEGDILFGGANRNTLILGPFDDGARFDGVVRARDADPERAAARAALFGDGGDGGGPLMLAGLAFPATGNSTGFDVDLNRLGLEDMVAYLFLDGLFRLDLRAGESDAVAFRFLLPSAFRFGDEVYDADAFASFLAANGVQVVPIPAALPLLLSGLGALVLLKRRRAKSAAA